MAKFISRKMKYVRTDGWRGYQQPIAAVAGANDTGMYSDSPCKSDVRKSEIEGYRKLLRAEKINSRIVWGKTSNVFCVKCFVCVADEDKNRAIEIAKKYQEETQLFYVVN